jgi:hypothetical protein
LERKDILAAPSKKAMRHKGRAASSFFRGNQVGQPVRFAEPLDFATIADLTTSFALYEILLPANICGKQNLSKFS